MPKLTAHAVELHHRWPQLQDTLVVIMQAVQI